MTVLPAEDEGIVPGPRYRWSFQQADPIECSISDQHQRVGLLERRRGFPGFFLTSGLIEIRATAVSLVQLQRLDFVLYGSDIKIGTGYRTGHRLEANAEGTHYELEPDGPFRAQWVCDRQYCGSFELSSGVVSLPHGFLQFSEGAPPHHVLVLAGASVYWAIQGYVFGRPNRLQ